MTDRFLPRLNSRGSKNNKCLLIGVFVKERKIAYSLIIGFEVIEKLFLEKVVFKEVEGVQNIFSDVVVGLLSYELARRFL